MRSRFPWTIASRPLRQLAMLAAAAVVVAPLSAQSPPRPRDGHPDLQGTWNFSSLTPLERPAQFADKPVLTDAEAADFERETLERTNADRRRDTADADVAQAYNNAWYDRGTKVVGTKRSSLIIDTPFSPPRRTHARYSRERTNSYVASPWYVCRHERRVRNCSPVTGPRTADRRGVLLP